MKTVREYFNVRETKGDVGVEVEVEGENLPEAPKGWRGEADGSLRGESREYVLSQPVPITELNNNLNRLKKSFVDMGSKFNESFRAGVHVHVNVQELTTLQLANMIVLYYLFEDNILSTCRNDRQGNHFCLRGQDAHGGVLTLKNLFLSSLKDCICDENGDKIRYSAMNVKCLGQYGSLEFRSLESTYDFNKISNFAKLHVALREYSRKFETPKKMMDVILQQSAWEVSRQVFGDLSDMFIRSEKFYERYEEGLELAEDLAFCKEWNVKSLDIFSPIEGVF